MNNKHENWPAWATEEIVIAEYDPMWPMTAEKLIAELKSLYPFENTRFEHIGSTAVPGLPAKPVIDMMLAVNNFDGIEAVADALSPKNWYLIPPELTDTQNRRTFVKVVNDRRFAHLHLVVDQNNEVGRHIAFRDQLRQNRALANEYSALKKALAQKFKNDREGYTDAKADFINKTLNSK